MLRLPPTETALLRVCLRGDDILFADVFAANARRTCGIGWWWIPPGWIRGTQRLLAWP